MKVTVGRLADLLGGTLHEVLPETEVTGFATDSRDAGPGTAFLAIRGSRVDGHDFVSAVESAVSVTERIMDAPCIVVPDLVAALARAASTLRASFSGPVVAVTGSNGKTTTKEFLAAGLSALGPVLKSEGNRNTEYTSPLVWFDLDASVHRAVVVEMGMRGFGQIAHLASFARPTIGVVTNIGTAHVEMVESRAGIARAKGELLEALPPDGVAVLPADDEFLADLRALCPCPMVTFGFSPDADASIQGYRAETDGTSSIQIRWKNTSFSLKLPMIGRHQAQNAAAAFVAVVMAGVDPEAAARRISEATPPPMRMEIRRWQGRTILMDAYNASPDSMIAALKTLVDMPSAGPRIAVLGDMKELGRFAEQGHRQVGRVIAEGGLDRVIFMGEMMRFARDEAVAGGYPTARIMSFDGLPYDEVCQEILNESTDSLVLIKGSRSLEMERILAEVVV